MERLMAWALRNPRLVVVVIAIISIAAASQLPKLTFAISPQSLIIEDDPDQAFYEHALETFGSDRISIVYIADPELFQPQKLSAIQQVANNLEALPFVRKTRSLFNVPDVRVEDDLVITRPFLQSPMTADLDPDAVRARALKNPFVRKNLLSDDGRAMAINVYLSDDDYRDDPAFDAYVAEAIQQAIQPLNGIVDTAYQIGLPYVRSALADTVAAEQYQTIGAALGVLLLSLLVMFRRPTAFIIPIITAGLSIIWLLGAMAALHIPLSVLTALVPVLIIIIGSTEDVHLLAETYDGLNRHLSLGHAIRKTIKRLALAITLTFLTSVLGFLAVSANPLSLVREFGLVAATGLAANFLLTAVLVPILLRASGEKLRGGAANWASIAYGKMSAWITRFILLHRGLVLAACLATMGLFIHASASLQINNNILNYFAPDSPIQQRVRELGDHLAGLYTLQIVVDGHIDGAFERVTFLHELQEIQRFIDHHPLLDHSMSFADYIAVLNSAVNETGEPELPDDSDVVEALMLFVGPEDISEYLSYDRSQASIVVRHGISESQALGAALRELQTFIDEHTDPDLHVTITGESVLTDNAIEYLVDGQVFSLILIVATIFVTTALLFVNAKAGLIAVVVNLLPIAALFGVMGWAGIPLDSATSMIAALAVGIGVDHTMHFMVRYNLHFSGRNDELTAVAKTIHDEARPIGAASLALAAGFGTLALSSFPPVYYFGLLSAMTMAFSFLATFILAPVLLSYVRLITIWEFLGTRVRHELQERCDLFRGMSVPQIRRVIVLGRVVRFAHGEAVMRQGEVGHDLYILLNGNVEIAARDGGSGKVNVVSVGDVFGVAALMCGKPRVATAVAVGNAEVLALSWNRLQRLARFFPRSAYLLFKNLSIVTGERLANHVVSTNGPVPDAGCAADGNQ